MKKYWPGIMALCIVFILAVLALGFSGLFSNHRDSLVSMSPDSFSTPRDLIAFLDANGFRLSEAEMDSAVIRLLALQHSGLKAYEKQMFSEELNPAINRYSLNDLTGLANVQEEAIRELIRSVLADGFRLSSSEGMIYPEIDYPGIQGRFGMQVSESMSGYLAIMSRETERHFAEDAALSISPDELAERLAAIEEFAGSHPDCIRIQDIERLQGYYLSAFLLGLNNTPAFDYETGLLDESFSKSYRGVKERFPGTRLARLVSDYLVVLERNGFKKTDEVLDFAVEAAPQPRY